MAFYGKKEYWDERYTRAPDPYEWYQSYQGIRHLLSPFHLTASQGVDPAKPRRILEFSQASSPYPKRDVLVPLTRSQPLEQVHIPPRKNCRILVIGCGNSRLAEEMVQDGWTGGIVCVDWSAVVIGQMEAKYSHGFLERMSTVDESTNIHWRASNSTNEKDISQSKPLIEFCCANILEGLPFDDCSFDVILSKGSFDAVISSSSANARRFNQECYRLLHPHHGSMVIITHGNPESRLLFFENPPDEWWSGVAIHAITKPIMDRRQLIASNQDGSKCHYGYICRKRDAKNYELSGLPVAVETDTTIISVCSSNEENKAL